MRLPNRIMPTRLASVIWPMSPSFQSFELNPLPSQPIRQKASEDTQSVKDTDRAGRANALLSSSGKSLVLQPTKRFLVPVSFNHVVVGA